MQKFEIIWPEHRWVSAEKIDIWFSDAVANGQLSEEYASDPQFTGANAESSELKALELHKIGLITLGRGRS